MIYLDFNATTPVDERVLEAMLPFFSAEFGNASSAQQAVPVGLLEEVMDHQTRPPARLERLQQRADLVIRPGKGDHHHVHGDPAFRERKDGAGRRQLWCFSAQPFG